MTQPLVQKTFYTSNVILPNHYSTLCLHMAAHTPTALHYGQALTLCQG